MTARTPLVIGADGIPQQLQAGDTLPGPSPDKTVSMPNGNYTLALADRGTVVANGGGGAVITIPPHASVAWPVGSTMILINYGPNPQTLVRGSGVSLYKALGAGYANADVTLAGAAWVTLLMTANDLWLVTGTGIS